jgi:serine/threonine protein kinase
VTPITFPTSASYHEIPPTPSSMKTSDSSFTGDDTTGFALPSHNGLGPVIGIRKNTPNPAPAALPSTTAVSAERAASSKPPFPKRGVVKTLLETQKASIHIIRIDAEAAALNHKQWGCLKGHDLAIEKNLRDGAKAKKEMQMVARRCLHPNIVKYFGMEQRERGTVSVFMEYINLGSLRSVMLAWPRAPSTAGCTPRGPTAAERLLIARAVTRQALEALLYYHIVEDMYHRDVKPDNLLLSDKGRVKLCDFDSSKSANESGMTMEGTEPYMAPEVIARDTDQCTGRIDVWSIGLVLYEILAGRHILHGVSMATLLNPSDAQQTILAAVGALDPIYEPAKSLILRCLERDAGSRITCADALLDSFFTVSWSDFIDSLLHSSAAHDATTTAADADTTRETLMAVKAVVIAKPPMVDTEGEAQMKKRGIEIGAEAPALELTTWANVRKNERQVDQVMRSIIHYRQCPCHAVLATVLNRIGHMPKNFDAP